MKYIKLNYKLSICLLFDNNLTIYNGKWFSLGKILPGEDADGPGEDADYRRQFVKEKNPCLMIKYYTCFV